VSEPHKCPVCEGTGKKVDERIREQVPCSACKGTGVVWEPQEAAAGGGDPLAINGL
jgi:DnaJ-class molecular chaperone